MASPQFKEAGDALVNRTETGLHIAMRTDSPTSIVGGSAAMREVRTLIRQVAHTNASVLITGASGTGKELAARAIHALSSERDGPFVAINCAALPETLIESELFGCERGAYTGADTRRAGCFELADTGTLFLDEVGEMSCSAQAKLLRVVEDRRVRRLGGKREIAVAVRIIASTKVNLHEALNSGDFREDLYYRLKVFGIELPSLDVRSDDIPALVECLILGLNRTHDQQISGINSDALSMLCSRSWPGNVRELKNVLERAVILAREGVITTRHLEWNRPGIPIASRPHVWVTFGTTIEAAKISLIHLTVRNTESKTVAAKVLGISYKTLCSRIAEGCVAQSATARKTASSASENSSAMTA